MNICKVYMPIGSLGAGIREDYFELGLGMEPDVIAIDAGSTDSGPYYLGTGKCKYSREMLKHDLRIALVGGKRLSIPVLIGSCGTCGTDSGVDEASEICLEILREEGIHCKIAKIYSQQNAKILKEKWNQGKIRPLEGAPLITSEVFDECSNIVALAGAEPFIKALNDGADIVLCGRATDTANIAALPIMRGCNVAASWHGAKVVECGSQCTENPMSMGVMLTVDEKGFYVVSPCPDTRCTPYSVSAHMLYENADPYRLTEPSGVIDTVQSVYSQVDDKTVFVENTKYEPAAQYTMKLEGAAPAGYQTISLVGIQDRNVLQDIENWITNMSNYVLERIAGAGISSDDYSFNLKPYGWSAVSGEEVPKGQPAPREIGLLLTVTAKTQQIATIVAKTFNPYLLHFPANMSEQLPSFAFPFSPAEIEKGPVYEFKLHHVVEVDDPLELLRIEYIDNKSKKTTGKECN